MHTEIDSESSGWQPSFPKLLLWDWNTVIFPSRETLECDLRPVQFLVDISLAKLYGKNQQELERVTYFRHKIWPLSYIWRMPRGAVLG